MSPFERGGPRLVKQAIDAAGELRRTCEQLPRTGDAAVDESPMAEQMHFKKAQKALALGRMLADLKATREQTQAGVSGYDRKMGQTRDGAAPEDGLSPEQARELVRLQRERGQEQSVGAEAERAIQLVETVLREADDFKWPGGEPLGPYGQKAGYDPNAPVPVIRGGRTRLVHPDFAKPYSLEDAEALLRRAIHAIEQARDAAARIRMAQADGADGQEEVERLRPHLTQCRDTVASEIEDLHSYSQEAQEEIQRLEENRDKLLSGAERLKSDDAKDPLARARADLQRQLTQHRAMLGQMRERASAASQVLVETADAAPGGKS